MKAKIAIERFFEKNKLSLTDKNKEYPDNEKFIKDFKVLFEKFVTVKVGNRNFNQPFKITKCKDCISDYIIKTQIFYKSLIKE